MVWGLLARLFSKTEKKASAEIQPSVRLVSGGLFDVVGEASYQVALERLCGGRGQYSAAHQCQALLVPEPLNPHDPNAVQITINQYVVGYLSRAHAVEYHRHIGARVSVCQAKIVGGWDDGISRGHFGVKLKIKWPPKSKPL